MRVPLVGAILGWAQRLRFPQLLVLTGALFVLDLLVPDPIPLVDELLLGLGTLLFAAWRRGDAKLRRRPRRG
jgi:hypothetical protein